MIYNTPEATMEVAAWNGHRERHRRPIGQPPFELRRKSRREQTPHNAAVAGFATAINEAEKHRRTLKHRFGYNDQQIGTMAIIHNMQARPERPMKVITKWHIPSGANSLKDGTILVDSTIAREFPEAIHPLVVHESKEAKAMAEGMPYLQAHTKIATPAERAAVRAAGMSWKKYTDRIDGLLSKIEHITTDLPPMAIQRRMHVSFADSLGHHRNKA